MAFFDRMERRFGWLAFPGFLRVYAIFQALVVALQMFMPHLKEMIEFDRKRVLAGEVWRLLTFLFVSPFAGATGPMVILFCFFLVSLSFLISDSLEGAWGTFKTSVFFYFGWLSLVLANFICPVSVAGSGFFLYGAAFLAFATLFPKFELRVFFVIPVQIRFLAMLQVILMVMMIVGQPLSAPFYLLGFSNFLIWAAIPAMRGQVIIREAAQKRKVFNSKQLPAGEAFHRCKVCGRTDLTDPALDFRATDDGEEYCEDHLPK
jgi:hypothetical protein